MALRTFFWDPVSAGQSRRPWQRNQFKVGNAGDLYNRDLIKFLYGTDALNVSNEGRRLLLVGSVAHRVLDGDIVAGIGTKGVTLPPASSGDVSIRSVRGPITLEAFDRAGYDTSQVTEMLDPGLLASRVYESELADIQPSLGNVLLIPHYRDYRKLKRDYFGLRRRGIKIASPDCTPVDFAMMIAGAEKIVTSSLHGLIFAHAIGREAQLVAPEDGEPMIKYQDYFASVDLTWSPPLPFDEVRAHTWRSKMPDVKKLSASTGFPTIEELRLGGILPSTQQLP